jgi:hypothetical protein
MFQRRKRGGSVSNKSKPQIICGDDDDDDDDGGLDDDDDDCGGGGGGGTTCSESMIGYLPLTLQTGVPSITSISPNGGTVGDSNKTITVTGQNLEDQLGVTGVSISGSGITSSVSTPGASNATVTYSIANNGSTGAQSFTISNSFGTSSAVTFTVVDPSPTVTGVSPSTWSAGSSYTVTITGTNFGTNPSVSIALPTGTITPTTSNPSDTSVTVSFTVPTNSPSGSAPVTVTSRGFNGSGFYPGSSGNSPSATNNSGDVVAQTPVPQIMIIPSVSQASASQLSSCTSGTLASSGSNETDVFAGQQILLCVAAPPGFSIVSSSWGFDTPTDISGGFVDGNGDVGSQPSASVGGSEAADPDLTQSGVQFYFVNPGTTETATYHWTLSNGDPNGNTSTADFNIQGPTGVSLNDPESYMNVEQVTTQTGNNTQSTSTYYVMGLPSVSVPGIQFSLGGVGSQNAGTNASFMWVQVLTDKGQSLSSTGKQQCLSAGYPTSSLDNLYPYPPKNSNSTVDSPKSHEISNEAEDARTFHATMYAMWNPALPSGCTPPSTTALGNNAYQTSPGQGCTSIPIPLGSVAWSACADAINTQNSAVSASEWTLGCAIPQNPGNGPTFNTNSGFPNWQTTALTTITVNGQTQVANDSCTPEP